MNWQRLNNQRFDAAREEVRQSETLSMNVIKGPHDLFTLQEMRRFLDKTFFVPPAVKMHCILLGTERKGWAKECLTMLGGNEVAVGGFDFWPCSEDGRRLPFVGQIDFRVLPGWPDRPLLQIFQSTDQRKLFHCQWAKLGGEVQHGPAISGNRLYAAACVPILSYPVACATLEERLDRYDANGKSLLDLDFCLTPLAIQIGPAPYIPPYAISDGTFNGLEIVACLPTIYPQANAQFEFFDKAGPLSRSEAENAKIIIGPEVDADSFGILYICQHENRGDLTVVFLQL